MDDQTTPTSEVNEYKFDEADVGSSGESVEQQPTAAESSDAGIEKPASSSKLSDLRRKLQIPVIIVIAILLMYGAFSFWGSKKSKLEERNKVQTQESIAKQQLTIPTPPKSLEPITSAPMPVVTPTPVVVPASTLSKEQIEQIQNTLQQKLNEVTQSVSSNHAEISGLKDTIVKSQQDLTDINQTVNQLVINMQQILKEIQALKAKPKKKISQPLEIYHIRAIVPGRVWLESASGKSVTLRVGDSLEGYGKVEVISPRQGMVIMSNGSYIQYGVNDF